MRKTCFIWSLFLITMGSTALFMSCSSNDDDTKEDIVYDTDAPQEVEGISVSLQLLNKDGKALRAFKEGEEICFKLTIENHRGETAQLPSTSIILGENLFRVYTSDHIDMGRSWDEMIELGVNYKTNLEANESISFSCPWIGMPDEANSMWLIKKSTRYPLQKGKYYSLFEITLDHEKKVTCKKEFNIN